MEGLEPPYFAASDTQSDVYHHITPCAFGAAKVMVFLIKSLTQTLNKRLRIIFNHAIGSYIQFCPKLGYLNILTELKHRRICACLFLNA